MGKYRQTDIKKNLELRAQIIQAIRRFFIEQGFLEIETPCRIPAPAPEAHIDAEISGDWFLQTSPELYMKSSDQVVVGGGLSNPMGGDFATDNIFYKVRHVFGGVVLSSRAGYASSG